MSSAKESSGRLHRHLRGLSCMQMSFLTGGGVLSDHTVLCKLSSKEVQPVSYFSRKIPVKYKHRILRRGQTSVV